MAQSAIKIDKWLNGDDVRYFEKCLLKAQSLGMQDEFLTWVIGGIKQGMTLVEACNETNYEWDIA